MLKHKYPKTKRNPEAILSFYSLPINDDQLNKFGFVFSIRNPLTIKSEREILGRSLYLSNTAFLFEEYSPLAFLLQKIGALENHICHALKAIIFSKTLDIKNQILNHLQKNHYFNKEPSTIKVIVGENNLAENLIDNGIDYYTCHKLFKPDPIDLKTITARFVAFPFVLDQSFAREIGHLFVDQAKKEYIEGNPVYDRYLQEALYLLFANYQATIPVQAHPTDFAAKIIDKAQNDRKKFIVIEGERGLGKSTLAYYLKKEAQVSGLDVCVISLDKFFYPEPTELLKRMYLDSKDSHYPPSIKRLIDLKRLKRNIIDECKKSKLIILEGLFSSEAIPFLPQFNESEILFIMMNLRYNDHIIRAFARDIIKRHPVVNPDLIQARYDSVLKNTSYLAWKENKLCKADIIVEKDRLLVRGQPKPIVFKNKPYSDPVFEAISKSARSKDTHLSHQYIHTAYELAIQFNSQYLADRIRQQMCMTLNEKLTVIMSGICMIMMNPGIIRYLLI